MADVVYTPFRQSLGTGGVDFSSDDVRLLLATSAYTPSAGHQYVSSITGECTGTGYTRKTLSNISFSAGLLTADELQWSGANFGSFRYAIFYLHDAGGDSSSELIGALDLTIVTTDGSTLRWNPTYFIAVGA